MTYPVFASGDVLLASDMNAVGMWLVKTQTIGSAVSSVTVTGAFSADYDNYRIIISGGAASASADLKLTLGSTTTGYFYGLNYVTYTSSTPAGVVTGAGTSFVYAGAGDPNVLSLDVVLRNPFNAKYTALSGTLVQPQSSGATGSFGGVLANTTSYTAFTITPGSGTITGGTIFGYGMRG